MCYLFTFVDTIILDIARYENEKYLSLEVNIIHIENLFTSLKIVISIRQTNKFE